MFWWRTDASQTMTIFLFNPNSNARTTVTMAEICQQEGLAVKGMTAPFGPKMIVEEDALRLSADACLAMTEQVFASEDDIEGIIVAAFGDPGLVALKALPQVLAGKVAIVGIGEASFIEAASGGRRFAVATTTPDLKGSIAAAVGISGKAECFVGSFFTDEDPVSLVATPDKLVDSLSRAVISAERAGAEAVIIGGGPLALAARKLRQRHSIPIIEPVPAAARLVLKRLVCQRQEITSPR